MSKFKVGDRVIISKRLNKLCRSKNEEALGTVVEVEPRKYLSVKRDDGDKGSGYDGSWFCPEADVQLVGGDLATYAALVAELTKATRAADAAEQARKDALAALVAHIEEEARK